ncbi:hypothetical protein QR680_016851 [Steinernema hermaphroditum]|uniref:G domain-containing protein n=1 Tax=Steinernema hermaphroditum TaxID=289476 RepID=A0AA39LN37_9BILA|nr:hypothetical protein QR680_016851 [Steinernema hermaphroditum]
MVTGVVHLARRYLHRAHQIAIIGAPNVGKSLVTNRLIRADVSAVSSKMDTTTKNVTSFLTEKMCQLTVVDSPGTVGISHAKKVVGTHAEDAILTHPEKALEKADHILVIQDATAVGDYIHHRVLHLLHRYPHLKSSLVLNKIDLVERRADLLRLVQILTEGKVGGEPIKTVQNKIGRLGKAKDVVMPLHNKPSGPQANDVKWMEQYRKAVAKPTHRCSWSETKHLFANIRGWNKFSSVFFVSALNGEGIDNLRKHLMDLAEPSVWKVDETTITTKEPQAICIERVRAEMLDHLPSDVAYKLKISICEWQLVGDVLQIIVDINCDKARVAQMVLGKGGSRVAAAERVVNKHLQNLFQQQLFVRLHVRNKNQLVEALS